ncbi:MAG: COP23 domain-containing protein [Cyanobacteria bacterium J06621_8]
MSKLNFLKYLVLASIIALASLRAIAARSSTAGIIQVSCEQQTEVPTVIATLSNQSASQVVPILSFLPEYFSTPDALSNCENTAAKLNIFYQKEQMNYLASDAIDEMPVICAVERRGLGCDSYGSAVLFSLKQPVSPAQLLFDMLGDNFKGTQLPSSRTVSRIYTDLRPDWWPF